MATLESRPEESQSGLPSHPQSALPRIPARTQLAGVAWLRWRIFLNSLRTRRAAGGGWGSLVLAIVLRLILWPVFALWVIGPVFASGYVAWTAIANHRPLWLVSLLAGIWFVWQFIAVGGSNFAASMPTFDPSSLLRFPIPFGRYLLLRCALGLLTPSTVIGCLALFAAAIGIAIADLRLAPMAVLAMGLFALMNIFLARMIGSWLERVLAMRRAREVFGGLFAIAVVSFQFLQLRRPRQPHTNWLFDTATRSAYRFGWLPPGYAADAVLHSGHIAAQLGNLLLLSAWAAAFLAGFAYRLHREYLGEHLSDAVANSPAAVRPKRRSSSETAAEPLTEPRMERPSVLSAMLRKEWLSIRSNTGQLVGLATPLIFVWLMGHGLFGRHPSYLLTAGVGYAILTPMAAVYNVFGPEGAGVQLYLLAPVRMRDVLLAKNIASALLLSAEAALAWIITVKSSSAPIPVLTQLAVLLWLVFVLAINLGLGTLRSIQSPRKFMPGQTRQMRSAPASRTSALLVLGLVSASMLVQIPVTRLSRSLHQPWLPIWVYAVLALAALAGYALMLANVDALVERNRDVLEHELCGV